MGFSSIRISHFRNLKEQEINLSHKNIYLIGKNGQGKTNFLELVYFLCYASSFRTRNDKNLIREGDRSFHISGDFRHSSDSIANRIDVHFDPPEKKIRLNGKNVVDRKDIVNNIPCIVFCHNDLYFVNGSPEKKRVYLDQCLSLHDPQYITSLRQYKKILKERNFLLKEKKTDLLEVYTAQLVEIGYPIQLKRKKLINYLNEKFGMYYERVTGVSEPLKLHYNHSWKEEERENVFRSHMDKISRELQYGLTLSGPHRDSFSILQNRNNYLDFASTGQLRVISLILRILQAEFYLKSTGRLPLLLVDDVLLELDDEKRKRMMDCFPSYEQIFYTFLPGEAVENEADSLFYQVKDGTLESSGLYG